MTEKPAAFARSFFAPFDAGFASPRLRAMFRVLCGALLFFFPFSVVSMSFDLLPASLTWFDEAGRHLESLDSERPVGEHLLMQFYRGVTSLLRKVNDLEDAYRALSVVIAARESYYTGQRMVLPKFEEEPK